MNNFWKDFDKEYDLENLCCIIDWELEKITDEMQESNKVFNIKRMYKGKVFFLSGDLAYDRNSKRMITMNFHEVYYSEVDSLERNYMPSEDVLYLKSVLM